MQTNNSRASLLDLFHLDPSRISDGNQIRTILQEHRVNPTVIDWLFQALCRSYESGRVKGYDAGYSAGYSAGEDEAP